MRYLLLILIFASCNTLKVTNIVETTNDGCVYYFWSERIDNWFTVVDTCNRFEFGYRIKYDEFKEIQK